MNQSRSLAVDSARVPALWVPAMLLAYGLFRFLDRLGGTDRSGPLWVAGHVCFLVAIIGVAALDVMVWRRLGRSLAPDAALVAGLLGSAAFVWVILGDIFPGVHSNYPVPDLVAAAGPPAFLVGLFGLLGSLAHRGLFPWPHWALVVIGFGCVGVSLQLLPLAAVILLLAFEPFRSATRRLVGGRAPTGTRLPHNSPPGG
ncbi:hypothetical protein [Flexivirga oryzae]|uniref:Uncharacterized protein n=1 Tax=Flexivirga oryzae TaxID=1794944 RepID=A0A839N8J8_9MICO|nr:hypothetical protein [Flexivirga oryzae]MBB2893119.1 hypothetical protein [Flexivirga oryzae]